MKTCLTMKNSKISVIIFQYNICSKIIKFFLFFFIFYLAEENFNKPSVLNKCFSILDKKNSKNMFELLSKEQKDRQKTSESINKHNIYGNIIINEWIDDTSTQNNSKSLTNHNLIKSNSLGFANKSSKQFDINLTANNSYFNLRSDEYIEEDDKLSIPNRAMNPKKKVLGITNLSEIKEKEDDYESSYKKHSRSRDSENLTNTLNRNNSKFSDSNIYQRNNMNSDSSNRLNSLHFSMFDKNNENLSSQNRSSQNRSSKKQVSIINYTVNNAPYSNSFNNNNNPNTINNLVANQNIYFSNNNLTNISTTNNILNQNTFINNTNQTNFSSINYSKTFANERQINNRSKIQEYSGTIKEIQDLVGLIKKKFYLSKVEDEIFYNTWDCPSIKENELVDIFKNYHLRSKLVKYCKTSFLKVKPNTTSKISSYNFDPVKAWICGIQIAAMNIQSLEDDQILINKMFFRFNKGIGYILKPQFLRSETYDRFYLKPIMKLKIDVISCLMLQTCVRNFNKYESIFFESYLVGSWEDDKINPKYKSKSYEKNLINLVFDNESIKFDVYEPDLCFWMIKIFLSNTVIARSCIPIKIMKEGIRAVPLYDLNCNEFPDCVILVRVLKSI